MNERVQTWIRSLIGCSIREIERPLTFGAKHWRDVEAALVALGQGSQARDPLLLLLARIYQERARLWADLPENLRDAAIRVGIEGEPAPDPCSLCASPGDVAGWACRFDGARVCILPQAPEELQGKPEGPRLRSSTWTLLINDAQRDGAPAALVEALTTAAFSDKAPAQPPEELAVALEHFARAGWLVDDVARQLLSEVQRILPDADHGCLDLESLGCAIEATEELPEDLPEQCPACGSDAAGYRPGRGWECGACGALLLPEERNQPMVEHAQPEELDPGRETPCPLGPVFLASDKATLSVVSPAPEELQAQPSQGAPGDGSPEELGDPCAVVQRDGSTEAPGSWPGGQPPAPAMCDACFQADPPGCRQGPTCPLGPVGPFEVHPSPPGQPDGSRPTGGRFPRAKPPGKPGRPPKPDPWLELRAGPGGVMLRPTGQVVLDLWPEPPSKVGRPRKVR